MSSQKNPIIFPRLASNKECTGCSSCFNACPKGCIEMREDFEGFLQPKINKALCIGCHICETACPVVTPLAGVPTKAPACYAAKHKEDNVRLSSSSGGVFYSLARWIIDQHGVVFGAKFSKNWNVVHDYTETIDGIKDFQKSKYVQSETGGSYNQVKRFLNENRWVLFSGTPCQIAGLLQFLGNNSFEKLITVDFICHGVPSPKVWRYYLKENFDSEHITSISFRDKTFGADDFSLATTTTTTTTTIESHKENIYFKGFLKNIFLRKSCFNCKFRGAQRISDITLADFWGGEKECQRLYDGKGLSLVITHTANGVAMLNNIKQKLDILPQMMDSALGYNYAASANPPKPLSRYYYFPLFNFLGFNKSRHWILHDIFFIRAQRKLHKILKQYAK